VVVGEMDPAIDIPNIQDAVDNYDKVLLRGSFDFGYDGVNFLAYPPELPAVYIQKDVEICGETDNKGEPLTKISGGFWAQKLPLKTFTLIWQCLRQLI
jgi:hypothetical protein